MSASSFKCLPTTFARCLLVAVMLLTAPVIRAQDAEASDGPTVHVLEEAPAGERNTLRNLLEAQAWPKRAIGAIRLARYDCEPSRALLTGLTRDRDWQVRCFALRSMALRGLRTEPGALDEETDLRVLRTALRYRMPVDTARIGRAVRNLSKSDDPETTLMAVELAAACEDDDLTQLANDTVRKIILRMKREEVGSLSPRLAVVLGTHDWGRPSRWQRWMRDQGRSLTVMPAHAVPEAPMRQPLEGLAALPPDRFAALEDYVAALGAKNLDLCICLDCTASMYSELAVAQGEIDDLMLFISDMVGTLRIALVAYRDRVRGSTRDDFETRAGDFTADMHEARQWLWSLRASGGGDQPEAVYEALHLAYTRLSWRREADKVLIVVGDAPPHVGKGTPSVDLARRARAEAHLTTHTIQAKGKPVKHFDEIAAAGEGRCVDLKEENALIVEITGLTVGGAFVDEFEQFFREYLHLCR
jgi:hypothetical protein